MRYFAYIGIVMVLAQEFAKAMADGTVTRGEWVDVIFNTGDKASETIIGIDLDPFRPVADEVKIQLAAGHASVIGLLRAVCDSLAGQGIDYKIPIGDGGDVVAVCPKKTER